MTDEQKAKFLMKTTAFMSNRIVSTILFIIMAYFTGFWVVSAIYYPAKFLIDLWK